MTEPVPAAPAQPAPAAPPAVVRLREVHKRYWRTEALRGVTLAIPRGAIVGILGPNGSGKSTLLKLIAGLVRPTAGEVLVEGRPPDRLTKARVAYVPEVDHLYPWQTVGQTLALAASCFPDWDPARAERLLAFMGLATGRPVGELSKGMRARLRLVLAFARRAPLVLLDEPLAGIDPPSRTKIAGAILAEYRAEEQTILVTTHEVLEAEPLLDRLVLMEQGRVRLEGEAEELRRRYGRSIRDLMEEVYG